MPYEDWWWDVVKSDPEGDEEIVGREREKYLPGTDPRYNPKRDAEEDPQVIDAGSEVEGTPFEGPLNRGEGEGKPRYETDKERDARKKRETEEKNRENWQSGGYGNIKLDDPRKKKEGWWGKIKQRNLIPGGGRKINENVPLVGGKRVPTMSLDDIDRATDNPGTKASRAIDRTKARIGQKWQDRVKRRYKKGKLPLFGKTPEEKKRKKEERKRRRR
jgi:hypothetical protein